MSHIKLNKTKVAAGAAIVALSGFVPTPVVQNAEAASTPINISGSFISGITIASKVDVSMGNIIASGATGKIQLKAGGATSGTNATIISGSAPGKIKATYKAAQPVDVTVAGFGKIGVPTNTATLTKMYFTGVFSATITGGTATPTASSLGRVLTGTGTGKVVNIGAGISWTGGRPGGAFAKATTVTIVY